MTQASGASGTVALTGLVKRYGATRALDGISLAVAPGEFFTLLGPSGCGKTTTLRSVAGFVTPDAGLVAINGTVVTRVPPHRRQVGMVFQHYALFPHRTVAQNVGFGLRMQRVDRAEIGRRVAEALALVQLPGHGGRYPSQLSGGEQQRVALARALAPSPSLLLLDEPLSALDARVRLSLRHEMKALQRRLGITTIMVTHDQEEALTMADRIVVMNHGVVEQIGTPAGIYSEPSSLFVARFVGAMNLLPAVADARPGWARVGPLTLRHRPVPATRPGEAITLGIRPEEVRVGTAAREAENRLSARVTSVQFQGAFTRLGLQAIGDGGPALECDLAATALAEVEIVEGAELPVALPADALRVFVASTNGA